MKDTNATIFDTENSNSIGDLKGDGPDKDVGSIASHIMSCFQKSKSKRWFDEQRMLRAYRNYRGIYGSDVAFTDTEKSRIFVKVTKTKVLAAYGQVTEVLLGNNKFPLTVDPTTLPEGVDEAVHFKAPAAQQVDPNTGQPMPMAPEVPDSLPELAPGETKSVYARLNEVQRKRLEAVSSKVKEGPGKTSDTVTIHPAQLAAKKMEKKIHDQLEESGANKHLRKFAFDLCLYGSGIIEGPYVTKKEYPRWTEDGDYDPVVKVVPMVSYVNVWNFYPDPDADSMDDSEYCFHRHKMSRSKLRKLKNRPFFRENVIQEVLDEGENYTEEWWETVLADSNTNAPNDRFEVLEFWGYMDTKMVEDHGVRIPSKLKSSEQLSVNVWLCGGRVIRLVLNPFKPAYLPYYVVPYEVNPSSFFGIGIAENMDDTQTLMNGFMRMSVDNAALSGNLLIEVDEGNLVPGQDLKVYPGKVFRRQAGAPGQAIFGTEFPNVSSQNMQMFDKARVLADESTGFPSFAHGQTGVTGVGRTAAGISMLMGAANGAVRTVIKNIDDYLLAPIGKGLFHFNMQFDYDPEIKGDLEVKAQGTTSLMANEVRSQRLMQFLGLVQNPALAPFAKTDYILREIAYSMELDPDKVTNNLADAAIQAEILKKFQEAQTPAEPPNAPGQTEGGPTVPSPNDTAGGGNGNIGVGSAPIPGEQGFSANVN